MKITKQSAIENDVEQLTKTHRSLIINRTVLFVAQIFVS